MKLAIMQPYIFPYIGYFQLINAVDKFIIYDDVTYIKGGWINRNNILINETPYLFTIPLEKSSSNKLINEIDVNKKNYPIWKNKILRTIYQTYTRAPYFQEGYAIVEEVFKSDIIKISELAVLSLKTVADYMNIKTEIAETSNHYQNRQLSGQERVIDICKQEGANHYINPIGGKELYSFNDFQKENIILNFLKTGNIKYIQFKNSFVPHLSVIDLIMHNSIDEIKSLLDKYRLI